MRFFSPSTGRAYAEIALSKGVHSFYTAGWACTLTRLDVVWQLDARFVGTKKQRQHFRMALADIVKGLVPEHGKFKIEPIKGGHRITWRREVVESTAEEISRVVWEEIT